MSRQSQAMLDLIPQLRRYARSLTRSSHDAEDLLQDCLTNAVENEASWRGTNLRAWMTRIMTNLNYNNLRKNRRTPPHIPINTTDSDPGLQSPNLTVEHYAFREAVEKLSADQRSVLMLVAIEGYSYGETAEILDIPVGTVMSRLSRARHFLAKQLSGNNIVELRSSR